MSSAGQAAAAAGVVPAQLGFLAIYNPSLGTTDETIEDQIVYYGGATVDATTESSRSSSSFSSSFSSSRRRRSSASAAAPTAHLAPDERNERLRQIGLAQGMVAFGRSFADDQAVDTIETDKTRVILHELEPGWWMLASIDLTRLPGADAPSSDGTTTTTATATAEYSAREVKPAALLLQDLLRAHSIFLLHHDVSLESLFRRVTPRSRFTVLLARYWDIFLSSWSVLLHGNPVRDVLPGMRLAASGELGIGVGEEERGSGEREVLEGLIDSTNGLVDLVVCKYGDLSLEEAENWSSTGQADDDSIDGDDEHGESSAMWLGAGSGLGAEDGAIFLGVGALSRRALRDLTYWMEDVYCWGHDAYGIADNPSAPARQIRHRKKVPPAMGSISEQQQQQQQQQEKKKINKKQQQPEQAMAPPPSLLPPPPVTQLAARRGKPSTPTPTEAQPIPTPKSSSSPPKDSASGGTPSSTLSEGAGGMDRYMSIMKLGYGTHWSLGGSSSGDVASDESAKNAPGTTKAGSNAKRSRFHNESRAGRFLIPLVDEADEKSRASVEASATSAVADWEDSTKPKEMSKPPPKAPPRTIFVPRPKADARPASQNTLRGAGTAKGKHQEADSSAVAAVATVGVDRLRVVVYAQRPFLYTFLFEEQQDDGAAKSEGEGPPRMSETAIQTLIDRQLSVLHKPLLSSTAYRPDKPSMVGAASMLNTAVASSSSSSAASGSIYDLIWDPSMLTIHSTIPNIPDPQAAMAMAAGTQGRPASKKEPAKWRKDLQGKNLPPPPPWSRVEALNTHMQILNMYAATRTNGAELERMCKTSRGWWIVWNRLVDRSAANNDDGGSSGRGQSKYGSTLFEEDEEDVGDDGRKTNSGGTASDDNDDDDDDGGGGGYQRAPSDCDSDDTATAQAPALGTYTVRKEIILIRKASDHIDNASTGGRGRDALGAETTGGGSSGGGSSGGGSSGGGLLGMGRASSAMRAFSAGAYLGFGSGSSGSGGSAMRSSSEAAAAEAAAAAGDRGAGWADGASRLAQGIGVDTKKYIEGLLTINK
ncbi:hypothetical protein SCUCBS95973_002657 [Sporothrix curviconia]|uniref:CCZ1/INTU/HSP4 first Longin domain-containing protein n=1 Tax=Sporothrix curviconia TaxID=1260050 RepID=A0ABP0B941_9PEZI